MYQTKLVDAVERMRAAAEPTRLRLLALLSHAELTVGEICRIARQSQPRVSRHLKLLCDVGLLDRFREQHWVYYRVPSEEPGATLVKQLLEFVDRRDAQLLRDVARMEQVIAERSQLATKKMHSDLRATGTDSPLPEELHDLLITEIASRAAGSLLDIGTGVGNMLKVLAPHARRAIGVDISSEALRVARTNVHGAGLSHCELQHGDMYELKFADRSFDNVVIDRVLAVADRPQSALAEAARTLKNDGCLLVIEDFDGLQAASERNPIATLRSWFDNARVECSRLHPLDTSAGHLILALAHRLPEARAA